MNTQETIELFNKYVIGNYGRLPRVIVKGEGCYLYDADGNKILDMFPGWAVSAIGHCHPKVVEASRRVCEAALSAGKHFGQPVPTMEAAEELIAMGGRLIFHNADVLMIDRGLRSMKEQIERLRGKLSK
jgi:4-aminobutyrate aminotransferase-like enzyme